MKKKIIWTICIVSIVLFFWKIYISNSETTESITWNSGGIIDITEQINEIEFSVWFIDDILDDSINEEILEIEEQKIKHIKTPENVKSLYFSANSINNEEKLNNFFEIAKTKEINSIMIDIKEVDWYTSFQFDNEKFWKIKPVSNNKIKNIKELIEKLHKNNIYVIARIVTFKDKRLANNRPDLALKWISNWQIWTDYKWNKYTDQYSKEVWNYHVELWKAAYDLGFDEINYDYIRFPTDWYVYQAHYPFAKEILLKDKVLWKVKVIDAFSNYITTELREYNAEIIISADVFWLVTDYTMKWIGQNLESFLLNFDFVWPMIYPSHYWEGYYGFKYPDNNPYWVISIALNNAKEKIDSLNIEINKVNTSTWNLLLKYNESFSYNNQNIKDKKINIEQIRPYLQWFSCTRCNNFSYYNRDKFRKAVDWINSVWIDSWWVRSAGSYYRNNWYNKKNENN